MPKKLTREEKLAMGLGRRAAIHKPTKAIPKKTKRIPRKAKHKETT